MPSSPNYVRNYKQEEATARARGDTKKRAERNKARREMMRAGKVHKGDGKDVDHTKPLGEGGKNVPSNLRVVSEHANRSFKRDSSGGIVSQTSKSEAKHKPASRRNK